MLKNPYSFIYKPDSDEVYSFDTQEGKEAYVAEKDIITGQNYLQVEVNYLPNQQYGAPDEVIAEVFTLYFNTPKYLKSIKGNLRMMFFNEDNNLIHDYDHYGREREKFRMACNLYRPWIRIHDSNTMYDRYQIKSVCAFKKEE
jgi:hypothetical protein